MTSIRNWLQLVAVFLALGACGAPAAAPTPADPLKVSVIIPQGTENDKGFNEFTLKGAREAAQSSGLQFNYVISEGPTDYERQIEAAISQGSDLVISMGFVSGDAVAAAARRHPTIKFLTDTVYSPGFGCPETVSDCYSAEGGLANVSSISYAEDEVGYLAGVLAGCMTKSGQVASVGGIEIPPVVRFVVGFQNGAKSVRPDVQTLNQYIPDFNDPATGMVVGQDFISQGADVIFVAAGNTGNGALTAAKEEGVMAIGVDADQYLTYPEVKEVLLSSAKKNVDVVVGGAVKDFAAGSLKGGLLPANVANGGVGLAPYHDWEEKIPQDCKDKVRQAEEAIKANPTVTGAK